MTLAPQHAGSDFDLVCAISRLGVFTERLAASPCVKTGATICHTDFEASSAAHVFNSALEHVENKGKVDWLVWVHEDVFLPEGWEKKFSSRLRCVLDCWPNVSVAGVYGVSGYGASAFRCGHVLDRGILLREPAPLPCLVDSIDELLVAVRVSSGIRMDPRLGFDFYASDLVLQAQAKGDLAVVVDAYCEHWSDTPMQPPFPISLTSRIIRSGEIFEEKWAHRLPILTPCFDIREPGSVRTMVLSFG